MQMTVQRVEFDKVSIVFGDHPERALPLMDEGLSRSEIQTPDRAGSGRA